MKRLVILNAIFENYERNTAIVSSDRNAAYKSFRLTVSDQVLVAAIDEIQRNTDKTEREIAFDALVNHLKEKELIEIE